MTSMDKDVRNVIKWVLKDLQVELEGEFLKNFERQGFFSEAWQRRKSPTRPGGSILMDTGQLRQSIGSRVTDNSVVFFTTLPYAGIHNDGGEIVVTKRMKGYFWRRYMNATGALAFARKKDGSLRRDKGTRHIVSSADFWKAMALMKEGSTIKIPQRKFLGTSPEVEEIVRTTIEESLAEYFVKHFEINGK